MDPLPLPKPTISHNFLFAYFVPTVDRTMTSSFSGANVPSYGVFAGDTEVCVSQEADMKQLFFWCVLSGSG